MYLKGILLNFLLVQWFRLYTLTAVAQTQSLFREPRSCKLHSTAKKKKKPKPGILVIVEFSLLVNFDTTKISGMNSFRSTFLHNHMCKVVSSSQLTEKSKDFLRKLQNTVFKIFMLSKTSPKYKCIDTF